MYQQDVVITAPDGIHTRPAGLFVREAMTFESYITVTSNGKCANAKRFFGLQTLDLTCGCTLTIKAEGTDEQIAVNHLIDFIKKL